jgi:predicted transcriptional regulator/transcriptional regulator with XRE-family HTH domain
MAKAFMGGRLRRLRVERGLTQANLAQALDLSPSYVNQLEKNQRPLTVPVLLRINAVFGVDVQVFSEDDEARLMADLADIFADQDLSATVARSDIRALTADMPDAARAIVAMHRRMRAATERADALAARLGGDGGVTSTPMPFEEVRDYFYRHHNYIDVLDRMAEAVSVEARLPFGGMADGLAARLEARHGLRVERMDDTGAGSLRALEPEARVLRLSKTLLPGQAAFQLATQIAFLEAGDVLDQLAAEGGFMSNESRALARIGLANHFAGALIMPYGPMLEAAEAESYDIDLLGHRFGVGFETVCHRLSTLQRPEARGVPFFFIRVDRAGNISKRQSATDFHFSRIGGSCPLWNVYAAFAHPGETLTQVAQMPDGRTYLWVARTVKRGRGGHGMPRKVFAVALGCDLRHAERLVYSSGLDLSNPAAATPIGAGCKVCERPDCPQRAFPPLGKPLHIDEARRRFAPYSAG